MLRRDLGDGVILSARLALLGVEFILRYWNGFIAPNLSDLILFEELIGVLHVIMGNRIKCQIHRSHKRWLRGCKHSLILFRTEGSLYSNNLIDLSVLTQAWSRRAAH